MLLLKLQQQQKQLAFKKPNYAIFGSIHERGKPDSRTQKCFIKSRDEDPTFFSTDPDPAKLEKYSGSDLNRIEEKNIFIF